MSLLPQNLSDTRAGDNARPALVHPNPFRLEIVEQMGAVLADRNAFRDRSHAFGVLLANGFHSFHVARFVDDARQVAMQGVVAREMGV